MISTLEEPNRAAPRRLTALALATLLMLLPAGVAGCGFTVPEGSVYISPTMMLEEHIQGLDMLFGPSYAVKVRYAGGKERAEFFYERRSGDTVLETKPMGSVGLDEAGFTWRFTIRLEPLPPIPGRDTDKPLEMLALVWAVGKRFTGRVTTTVKNFPRGAGNEAVYGSDRNEFGVDEDLPLVAFHRTGIPGRDGERETLLVKMRLVDETP